MHWSSDATMYEHMPSRLADATAARAEFARLLHHPERVAVPRRHWYLALLDHDRTFFVLSSDFEQLLQV